MAGRWINGVGSLINIDCLQSVCVFDQYSYLESKEFAHYLTEDANKSWLADRYVLMVEYMEHSSGLCNEIDKFEKEPDAIAAKDWFMMLLQGRIDIDDWNVGRKDREWRKQLELE